MMSVLAYAAFFLVFVAIYAIIALGLNLQWGATGLFNVGVAGFVATGAYTSALLTTPKEADRIAGFGLPFAVGMLAACLIAGLVGVFTGALTLRLRRDYLAITTFGVSVMIETIARNATPLTGGVFGVQFIPKPMQGWLGAGFKWNLSYLAMSLVLLAVVYWGLERLLDSPWGRVLRAIREDEDAASSIGKRVYLFRLQSFAVGSMLMGLGGALYAHFVGFIAPQDFLPILTFQLWAMLIVGGSGSNLGAILGSAVVWGFWSASGALLRAAIPAAEQAKAAPLQTAIIGGLIVATLLARPRGILGHLQSGVRKRG